METEISKLVNVGLGLCLSYLFAERAQVFELRRDLGTFRSRGPLQAERFPQRADTRLGCFIHQNLIGPRPRKTLGGPLSCGIDAHL